MTKTMRETILKVVSCTNCQLCQGCRSPVPLSVPTAGLPSITREARGGFIVLGEAPGRLEDLQGKPFVGPAGRYLKARLRDSGLDPSEGIYLNVVSCWPHGTPERQHIQACRGNLYDQLLQASQRAHHLLVAGSIALSSLLPHVEMKNVLGSWLPYPPFPGLYLYPVQHPSFIAHKASRDKQENWKALIRTFAGTMEIADMLGGGTCVYCNRSRDKGKTVCFKHGEKWRQDATWKPGVVQEKLL